MFIIGLTGGSGSGKGYVSKFFDYFGMPVLDTDVVYRNVTAPGSPCLNELKEAFTDIIILPDGSLHRKTLSEIVFTNSKKLATLNDITHKYILEECKNWLAKNQVEGVFASVVDAPQLFESKFNFYCDYIVSVVADKDTRIKRIIIRDGISKEKAALRIAAQHTDNYFISRSDFIIYNNDGDRPDLQVDLICQQIRWI